MAADRSVCGQAFNFSNEIQVTVLELVALLTRILGSDLTADVRNEAANEIRHQYLSAAKAKSLLGWEPLFTLEEGLARTVDWYREFLKRD
jgi:CDP-glucose 4,6-dehydratase